MRLLKIILTLFIVILSLSKHAQSQYVQPMRYDHYSFSKQVNIGVGPVRTTNASAYLEVGPTSGANKGFLPPRLTTTQRNSISSPAAGLFIYNSTTGRYNFYNGIAWADISASSGVDSLWRTPGVDSFYFLKNGTTYALKDSLGTTDTTSLSNRINQKLNISDTAAMLSNYIRRQELRDTAAAIRADMGTGGTGDLQTVTTNGYTTTNPIQLGSVNPLLSLKQATSNEEWKIRVGVGTGIASQVFNIYNETSGKHLITGNPNRVIIGNPTDAFEPSALYIKSYNANGTHLDVQPDSTVFDEGNIEIMASDYTDGKGIAMRQWGNVGVAATAMGYHKKNMALLDFTENFNIIRTNLNRSLRFGTNNIERMVLDSNGRLGIGTLSPAAWLEVLDASGAIATGIFNAHEDRDGEIVNIQQAGAKKFSFNSSGAIDIIESSAPSTPASGYVSVYANSSNSQLYLKNDAGIEKQLITQVMPLFGAGSGADADTTAFTTSALYGSFYNDADTIVVTSMRGVLQGTSPSVTYQVWYNDSLNVEAGGTKLVTAGNALTNTTTGTNVTSFDVTKIPPGNWVWVKTGTVATKPKYFSLTLNGYRK